VWPFGHSLGLVGGGQIKIWPPTAEATKFGHQSGALFFSNNASNVTKGRSHPQLTHEGGVKCQQRPSGMVWPPPRVISKFFIFFDLAFGTTLKGYSAGGHPQLAHGGGDVTPMAPCPKIWWPATPCGQDGVVNHPFYIYIYIYFLFIYF
jgi:hypothetical protein